MANQPREFENPVSEMPDEDELITATLGSLLIGSAATALESEKTTSSAKLGSVPRIEKLASSLPSIREETNLNIAAESSSVSPVSPVKQFLEEPATDESDKINITPDKLLASKEEEQSLFPRISTTSAGIPLPRHRLRKPYRRFVAPPPPSAPPSQSRISKRSTEIPSWAGITQADIAANVKGIAAAVADDARAVQNYRGVNANSAYVAYKADLKTRGIDSSGGDPAHWDELTERYPDKEVLIRDGSGDLHKYRVSNPYRAATYRRLSTFSFGNPSGLNPQQSVMAQQNLDILLELAPEEMIADTKYATALLESLWYCGAAKDIGGDPRCFPARVLGELREYKMYKDEKARAAFAERARQYSEWEFIRGALRKVRGQLSGSDRATGPVRISGIPDKEVAGPNLSARAPIAGLASRIAAAGVVESPAAIKKNVGPTKRPHLAHIARVALAQPPQTLGAIGLRPLPPPAVLGAWGSRFRPIIPGI